MSDVKTMENKEDPYGIRDIQDYILQILKDIDSFCRKYHIRYSVSYGTLIGAVRHGGFIPWDDDADLMFDRKNYERFMRIAKKKFPPEYAIVGDTWVRRITRADNPRQDQEEKCVDLFTVDNVPDNKLVASVKHFLLKLLQGMLKNRIDYSQYSGKDKVLVFGTHLLGYLLPVRLKQELYRRVSMWGDAKKTERVNIYNSLFREISEFSYTNDMMKHMINVRFEDTVLMAIKDYDQFLTECYGDYMKLPPEKDRKPMHKRED